MACTTTAQRARTIQQLRTKEMTDQVTPAPDTPARRQTRKRPPSVGPYSKPAVLAKVDGRTREGRLLKRVRADLTAHLGGAPSITQRMVIERAAALTLKLALLDAANPDAFFDEHASNYYLAWSNSLERCLRQLGLQPSQAMPTEQTLAEFLQRDD
jgi:hypothetical protein